MATPDWRMSRMPSDVNVDVPEESNTRQLRVKYIRAHTHRHTRERKGILKGGGAMVKWGGGGEGVPGEALADHKKLPDVKSPELRFEWMLFWFSTQDVESTSCPSNPCPSKKDRR